MERLVLAKYVLFTSIIILGVAIVISNYLYIWATKESIKMKLNHKKDDDNGHGPEDEFPMYDEHGGCVDYLQGFGQILGENGQEICIRFDFANGQFAFGTSEHDGWQYFCGHHGDDEDDRMCFRMARGGKYEPDNKYYCGHHNPNFAFTVVVLEDLKNTDYPTYIVQNDLEHNEEAYGSPDNFLVDIRDSKSYKKYLRERGGRKKVKWVISKSYSYIGPDKEENTIKQTSLLSLRLALRNLAESHRHRPIRLISEEPILSYKLNQEMINQALEADKTIVEFHPSQIPFPDLNKGNRDDYILYHIPITWNLGLYVGKVQVGKKIDISHTVVPKITNLIHYAKFFRVPKKLAREAEFCTKLLLILASTQPDKVQVKGESLRLMGSPIDMVDLNLDNLAMYQEISQLLLLQKFKITLKGDIDWTFNPFEGGEIINLEPQSSHLKIKSQGKIRNMTLNEVRNFLTNMKQGSKPLT